MKRHSLDLLFVLVGLLFAACSLAYPFGHDQGVHYYVGREWLLRGALPYRDAFDYKTPGIFLLHAGLIRVFGEVEWGIRVADLACTALLGWLSARLALPRDAVERAPAGWTGLTVLATCVFYFGFFSYWDTAQCEIWCVTLSFAALSCARSRSNPWVAGATSGLLGGAALIMKPPAVFLVGIAAHAVLERERRRRHGLVAFGVGLTAPVVVIAAYFAWRGGAMAAYDVLVKAESQYVLGVRRVDSFSSFFDESVNLFTWFNPFAAAAAAVGATWLLRQPRGQRTAAVGQYRVPLATLLAAYLGVAIQLKFYHYHYVLLVGPLSLLFATATYHALRPDALGWAAIRRSAALASLLLGGYALSGFAARTWWQSNEQVLAWVTGAESRDQFAAHFVIPSLYYNYADSERAGEWLRAHAAESDEIVVRGFEPEIYAVARHRYRGRFFWTIPFTDPMRTYRKAEWAAEDQAEILRDRPRFVVALSEMHAGPDASETFQAMGYEKRAVTGRLTILERGASVAVAGRGPGP